MKGLRKLKNMQILNGIVKIEHGIIFDLNDDCDQLTIFKQELYTKHLMN